MLPGKQLDRIQHCLMMVRITEANRAEWKLGADYNVARITELKTAANKTLDLYWIKKNPETATSQNTHKFQLSYKHMSDVARHFQHWIKGNTLVPENVLIDFMIGPRDPVKHEAKPVPHDVSGNRVDRIGLNTFTVVNFQMEEGSKRMTVRDPVNECVIRRYAILPHGQPLPENINDLPWITLQADHNMRHTFELSPAFNGMNFILQTAFANDRGRGPWSELYQITIS